MGKIAGFLALVLTMVSVQARADTPNWSVSEAQGNVTVARAGTASVLAPRGTILRAGDKVVTGQKSRAVIVRGQEYVMLSANSQILIAPPKAGSMVQIAQDKGTAQYKIKKKTTPHFSVQTPYLAAVVKGTTFSVTVSRAGASVQVTEGMVQVLANDGGASDLLTPGHIGMVRRDEPAKLAVSGGNEVKTIGGDANIPTDGSDGASGDEGSDDASASGQEDAAAEPADEGRTFIASSIGEGEARLDKLTGGMIGGDAAIKLAMSSLVQPPAPAPTPSVIDTAGPVPPVGNSAPNGGGSAPGTGQANADQGNAGTGTVGAGNGNGSGGASDDSGGNSGSGSNNGNNGGNGNGNGNNGSGNGNGGSGNAIAGIDDSVNPGLGIGVGNSDPQAGSGAGNTNGNGNGNGGFGNGNGNGNVGVVDNVAPGVGVGVGNDDPPTGGAAGNGNGNGNGGFGNGNGNGNVGVGAGNGNGGGNANLGSGYGNGNGNSGNGNQDD